MSQQLHVTRDVELALDRLVEMHEQGTLPPALEPLLSLSPPPGMRTQVELSRAGGRVLFVASQGRTRISTGGNPLADLLAVLDEAEQSPALQFVALKFLRDRLLPQTRYGWAQSPQSCQGTIAEAIDRGFLVTSKKPNPRNPEFPVTAVQIDRTHPEVVQLLPKTTLDLESDAIEAAEA